MTTQKTNPPTIAQRLGHAALLSTTAMSAINVDDPNINHIARAIAENMPPYLIFRRDEQYLTVRQATMQNQAGIYPIQPREMTARRLCSFLGDYLIFQKGTGDKAKRVSLSKELAEKILASDTCTYVRTEFDYYTGEVKEVEAIPYSDGLRSKVRCYGADDVREGVAIMWKEDVDVSITGNSTNPTRFQHPVAGTYKKERTLAGKKYFSVASGGGTGRTLHPDNMAAGPASYGMTDTMGRMHSDAQFAGSSSVPAHVEMMGFLGMGNNPMVGATVAIAVAIQQAMN